MKETLRMVNLIFKPVLNKKKNLSWPETSHATENGYKLVTLAMTNTSKLFSLLNNQTHLNAAALLVQ